MFFSFKELIKSRTKDITNGHPLFKNSMLIQVNRNVLRPLPYLHLAVLFCNYRHEGFPHHSTDKTDMLTFWANEWDIKIARHQIREYFYLK